MSNSSDSSSGFEVLGVIAVLIFIASVIFTFGYFVGADGLPKWQNRDQMVIRYGGKLYRLDEVKETYPDAYQTPDEGTGQ